MVTLTPASVGAVVALTGALLSGCSQDPPAGDTDPPPNGSLHSDTIAGGVSIYRPRNSAPTWSATFGFSQVCVAEGDAVTVDNVTYDFDVPPLRVDTYIRTVPGADDRHGGGDWQGVGSRVGTPERFADAPFRARGTFDPASGATVDIPCRRKDDEKDPFQEVVTVFTVGPRGARSNETIVHYTANGSASTLTIPFTYVACGDQVDDPVDDPEYCH